MREATEQDLQNLAAGGHESRETGGSGAYGDSNHGHADGHSNPAADHEQSALVDAVRAVMRLHHALERVDTGLTLPQYRVLALVEAGGERSARLAERLAVAKPTLTAAADVLVSAGYLEREAEPGDRRVVRLSLTPAGRAALRRADIAYTEWMAPLLDEAHHPEVVLSGLIEVEAVLRQRRAARVAANRGNEGGA